MTFLPQKPDCTRCDQIVLGLICFGEMHGIKIFVSRSFGLNEGHWECEKLAVMLGCLCKKVNEYDQEMPQSQTGNPVAPLGRAALPSRDTRKTN